MGKPYSLKNSEEQIKGLLMGTWDHEIMPMHRMNVTVDRKR